MNYRTCRKCEKNEKYELFCNAYELCDQCMESVKEGPTPQDGIFYYQKKLRDDLDCQHLSESSRLRYNSEIHRLKGEILGEEGRMERERAQITSHLKKLNDGSLIELWAKTKDEFSYEASLKSLSFLIDTIAFKKYPPLSIEWKDEQKVVTTICIQDGWKNRAWLSLHDSEVTHPSNCEIITSVINALNQGLIVKFEKLTSMFDTGFNECYGIVKVKPTK